MIAIGIDIWILGDPPGVDRSLHARDLEPDPGVCDDPVAVLDDLREIVPRVDVHHRERDRSGRECPQREPQHDCGVLAAGEQQNRSLELGGDLPEDVQGLGLEGGQMGQLVRRRGHLRISMLQGGQNG